MRLKLLQAVIARIHTDAQFRSRFFEDPDAIAATLGITPAEIEYLSALSTDEVRRFAAALHRKRADAVRGALPLTCRVLNDGFGELFALHADQFVPGGIRKHHENAMAFARFLMRKDSSDPVPTVVRDFARFESTNLAVWQSRTGIFIRFLRDDIRYLMR